MVDTVVKGKVASVPLPGATSGQPLPSFLGGSALGVTGVSKEKTLAALWIKYFTDTQSMQGLIAKGALPNATALLDQAAAQPGNAATAQAAKDSWFVPMAPKWADVESNNILQQMLKDIATGKKTVPDAASWADGQISTILNG
jgi:N,N'-diacetylchitobiose transport system substrate-binding protein